MGINDCWDDLCSANGIVSSRPPERSLVSELLILSSLQTSFHHTFRNRGPNSLEIHVLLASGATSERSVPGLICTPSMIHVTGLRFVYCYEHCIMNAPTYNVLSI